MAHYTQCETAARKVIQHVGKKVILGVPLGIGKPIGFLNALYKIASEDKSVNLTIITGLTLARPILHNELEKRFVEPLLDRMIGNYEDPLYEKDRELQQLPENITVIEFFLAPGKYAHNNYVQQNYISSCYKNVVRDLQHYSLNVIAQQVSPSKNHSKKYSLSSNPDLFHGAVRYLKQAENEGGKIAIVAEVNSHLPFMYGEEAIISEDFFTEVIDTGFHRNLFAIPREELSPQDHLIGLYTSCLIKDDGCLQVGIGKLSNAVANALIFRQKYNSTYQDLLHKLLVKEKFGSVEFSIFNNGLYASTEMLSDEYMQLYQENILKKKVYDHIVLQELLNSKKINDQVGPEMIDILLENGVIKSKLHLDDIKFLKEFGIFRNDILYQSGCLILSSGEEVLADLSDADANQKIMKHCLGEKLQSGKIIHAGFFLGSVDFYAWLRNLSEKDLQKIEMTSVARTNSLSLAPDLFRVQRQHARFVNSAMMVTLGGVVVSDGLKDLREISGVGGQFDFISMSYQLDDARSIINCRSTRQTPQGVQSNIIWDYENFTIPRYLRDVVVTEYGIADCRSKTDSDVIKAILNITDSRFQSALMDKAKNAGKLQQDYEIPVEFCNNYPAAIEPIIRELQLKGHFKTYPFGSDLTGDEQVIARALLFLKNQTKIKLFALIARSFLFFNGNKKIYPYLARMKLLKPKTLQEFIYKKLLILIISRTI